MWVVCDDLVCLDPLCSTLISIENVKYKNKSSCAGLKPEKNLDQMLKLLGHLYYIIRQWYVELALEV